MTGATLPGPIAEERRRDQTDVFTIGVVGDTHIPDRVRSLHPLLIPMLKAAGVQHILHTGDISTRAVLDELVQVAPVTAVRGNRDLLTGRLKMVEEIELGGARIALMHGHGGWLQYLKDKYKYIRFGYRLERYLRILHQNGASAHVIVFGHTHFPEQIQQEGQLLFNPGSASFGFRSGMLPTYGLLRVAPGPKVTAEIVRLEGWQIQKRRWVAI